MIIFCVCCSGFLAAGAGAFYSLRLFTGSGIDCAARETASRASCMVSDGQKFGALERGLRDNYGAD
jgi:hypothetical protein